MHAIVAEIVSGTVTKLVELTVDRVVRGVLEPRAPAAPATDPVEESAAVMDSFLRALADRDVDTWFSLCERTWAIQNDTGELLNNTLSSAPPISWAFTELYVPEDWAAGAWLPWLVAELAVTFDVGGRYETIPAVLRAISTRQGSRIDYLWWGETATPEPEPSADPGATVFPDLDPEDFWNLFGQQASEIDFGPPTAVIECARCGQKLRVPADKGRLRVTCRKCANVQWYVP